MTQKIFKKSRFIHLLASVCLAGTMLAGCGEPVFANVDPAWEEQAAVIVPETPAESPVPEAPEQGFSTPGNGDLGDEVEDSKQKDFYTIRTKDNKTFYLVIDHANSVDNVYLLSLVDEYDLEEFMDGTALSRETVAEPVQPTVTPTPTPEPTPTPTPAVSGEPEKKAPYENSTLWILGGGLVLFLLLYYFKIYKPSHDTGDDDSEGLETDDALPTEREE